jgi:hypothetical protein
MVLSSTTQHHHPSKSYGSLEVYESATTTGRHIHRQCSIVHVANEGYESSNQINLQSSFNHVLYSQLALSKQQQQQ